jgi:predicted ABC-type ATPase
MRNKRTTGGKGTNQYKVRGKTKNINKKDFETLRYFKTANNYTLEDIEKRFVDVQNYVDSQTDAGNTSAIKYGKKDRYGKIIWEQDRLVKQEQMLGNIIKNLSDVPTNYECVFSAGLSGSGKSSILRAYSEEVGVKYAVVNPDNIKEEMCKEGLIVGNNKYSAMELSPLYHEESSDITKRLLQKLVFLGKNNILVDTTFANLETSREKILDIRENGYYIIGIFVDTDIEIAKRRTLERFRRRVIDQYDRIGYGGRPVPLQLFDKMRSNDPKYSSIPHKNFVETDKLGYFDKTIVFDNNGSYPIKTYEATK